MAVLTMEPALGAGGGCEASGLVSMLIGRAILLGESCDRTVETLASDTGDSGSESSPNDAAMRSSAERPLLSFPSRSLESALGDRGLSICPGGADTGRDDDGLDASLSRDEVEPPRLWRA
jgi:hypothetical protein